jgi:prepilin-type N-terminal cleavage/methylation domain-containing protein/prepilin-type processing-associated H-X9-DG protein
MNRVAPLRETAQRSTPASPSRRSAVEQQRSFTLIELLVVVSIIALLISILLPSLKQAREQGKTVKCLAHSRGLGQAAMTFAADHNGLLQLATNSVGRAAADPDYTRFEYGTHSQAVSPHRELLAWPVALAQAGGITGLKNNWDWGVRAEQFSGAVSAKSKEAEGLVDEGFGLARCPSDPIALATPFWPQGPGQLVGPGDPHDPHGSGVQTTTRYYGRLSYGINEDIVGAEIGSSGPSVWKDGCKGETNNPRAGERLQGKLERVFDPASVLLLIDAGRDNEDEAEDDYPMLIISAKVNGPFLENVHQTWKRMPAKRHPKGQLNVTYADGHGASTRPVGYVMYGRVGPFPKHYSEPTRVSPYSVKSYGGSGGR